MMEHAAVYELLQNRQKTGS